MALRRIEAALTRLEAAAQLPAGQELAQIEASNARLREAIALSLRQIDALIARQGPEQQA